MTMRREWVATCDEPGCPVKFTGPTSQKEYEFGLDLNDNGWAAAPSVKATYCPTHFRELDVPEPDPDAIALAAAKFAAAIGEADERNRFRTQAEVSRDLPNG